MLRSLMLIVRLDNEKEGVGTAYRTELHRGLHRRVIRDYMHAQQLD